MIKKTLSWLAIAVTLLGTGLEAVWVSPPATLTFPAPTAINGQQSDSGNAVIFSNNGSGFYVSSKYFASTQTWGSSETLVATTDIPNVPSGAINAAGNAISVWVQDGASKTLNFAVNPSTGWTNKGVLFTATASAELNNLVVAMDAAGRALIVFSQDDGVTETVYGGSYNGSSWNIQTLDTVPTNYTVNAGNILNEAGQGAVFWGIKDPLNNQTINAATYLTSTEAFGPTTVLYSGLGGGLSFRSAISPSGLMIAVWNVNPEGLYAAIYNNGWLPTETIVPPVNGAFTQDGYGDINDAGQAIVAYSYNQGGVSSILVDSYDGSTWSPQTVTFSTTTTLFGTLAGIDSLGDGLVIWDSTTNPMTFADTTIQISYRTGVNGAWTAPENFAEGSSTFAVLPLMLQINQMNNAFLAWGDLDPSNGNITNLNISFGYDLFVPLSPSNFKGVQVKTKFATQTDIINRLTWTPSPNSAVTGYVIFRNGKLITPVPLPAQGPYVYEDHNRQKGVAYTYQLWSVIGNTLQSIAQTTVVP